MTSARQAQILIFEDTDADFERLRESIVRLGYRVTRANTPDAFRKHAPYRDFVLVVMDLFLGRGPSKQKVGIDLTREVKEANPNLPVIVVSLLEPARSDVAESFRAGATDYVDKTTLYDDIDAVMERVLVAAAAAREVPGEDDFPLPMAFLLRDFSRSQTNARRRLERLIEFVEVTQKLVAFALLSTADPKTTKDLISVDIRRGMLRPSLGHYSKLIDALPLPNGLLRDLASQVRRSRYREITATFVTVRNDYIGHGVLQTDAVYEHEVRRLEPLLREVLRAVDSLRQLRLIWFSSATRKATVEEFEAKVFRGSNPEATVSRIDVPKDVAGQILSDRVYLTDWPVRNVVDLFPWCQYTVCEQRCLNTKLFIYRMLRHGEVWLLDHIYGHSLQTRSGYGEIQTILNVSDE